jgi:anti-sigma28 factor (negative regulator of flagellin synthesis)
MRVTDNLLNPWLDQVGQSKNDPAARTENKSDAKQQASALPGDELMVRNVAGDEIRADKVAALQRAVASGTYTVPAEELADAMLRDWQG